MGNLYDDNVEKATAKPAQEQMRGGAVIVQFLSDGSPRVLPVANSDREAAALLDAFRRAARVGEFSDLGAGGGK